jgi:hypothetical protein
VTISFVVQKFLELQKSVHSLLSYST